MHFTNHKRRRAPTVIIVSLIDVLLVVLIFLMATTSFKKELPASVKVNLPESKQAKAGATETKPFLITVATNSPYFYIGEKPVTLDRLQNELAAEVKKDPQVRVAIKADKRSPFGEVLKVLDAAKAANVAPDKISALAEKPAPK